MEIPEGNPWKIAENRTLKAGSSPPRAEEARRLVEIKRKYDSDNFFHINQNIRPDAYLRSRRGL